MEIKSSINRLFWILSISLCLSLPIQAQLYQEVILEDIEFGPDQAIIENDSSAHLQALVDLLNKYPDFNVKIAGHSDEDEKSADLIDLSIKRAEAVKKALISYDISPYRIKAVGYGAYRPIRPEEFKDRSISNRRVTYRMMK